MLVDLPCTIIFDHDSSWRAGERGNCRIFTMRYDTTNTDLPAQWTNHYPPRQDAHWLIDEQGVLFDLLTAAADHRIKERAEADPENYTARMPATTE